jgi:hypothetical protein
MELMSWYRMGQSGPFSSFFKHTWHDDLAHTAKKAKEAATRVYNRIGWRRGGGEEKARST